MILLVVITNETIQCCVCLVQCFLIEIFEIEWCERETRETDFLLMMMMMMMMVLFLLVRFDVKEMMIEREY
jgi:hypothetical protein